MSRSTNKVASSHSGVSQKKWLRHAHHAERGAVKAILAKGDPEVEVIPERYEVSNPYTSPKDDMIVVFPGDEFWEEFEGKKMARK